MPRGRVPRLTGGSTISARKAELKRLEDRAGRAAEAADHSWFALHISARRNVAMRTNLLVDKRRDQAQSVVILATP